MILDHKITSINSQGNLLVDTRPWLDRQFLITNWNSGVGFYLKKNDCWQEEYIDPGLVLISDEHLKQKDQAIFEYLKKIPDDVIEQIKPYEYKQFTLLNLLSQRPALLDIFKHSANLVWITIIESEQQKWNKEETFKLLHYKREYILAKLYFSFDLIHKMKPIVRFHDKVRLVEANQYEYRIIKETIVLPNIIKSFLHWKIVPIQALAVVRQYPCFLNSKILHNLIDENESCIRLIRSFSEMNNIISDINDMSEVMEINLPENYFRLFENKNDLDRAHDRLITRFNVSQKVSNKKDVIFPDCPLGNKENLIQIKSSYELAKEGRDMHHCVGGYIRLAQTGQYYFYKVT